MVFWALLACRYSAQSHQTLEDNFTMATECLHFVLPLTVFLCAPCLLACHNNELVYKRMKPIIHLFVTILISWHVPIMFSVIILQPLRHDLHCVKRWSVCCLHGVSFFLHPCSYSLCCPIILLLFYDITKVWPCARMLVHVSMSNCLTLQWDFDKVLIYKYAALTKASIHLNTKKYVKNKPKSDWKGPAA